MKNTIVYIDGYNLYYGLLKGTSYKWLDLARFAKELVGEGHNVMAVKYFTSWVKPQQSRQAGISVRIWPRCGSRPAAVAVMGGLTAGAFGTRRVATDSKCRRLPTLRFGRHFESVAICARHKPPAVKFMFFPGFIRMRWPRTDLPPAIRSLVEGGFLPKSEPILLNYKSEKTTLFPGRVWGLRIARRRGAVAERSLPNIGVKSRLQKN